MFHKFFDNFLANPIVMEACIIFIRHNASLISDFDTSPKFNIVNNCNLPFGSVLFLLVTKTCL